MADALPKLTPRQAEFVSAYLGTCRFDATRAAIAVGYSPKSAARLGFAVKNHPSVRAHIEARLIADAMSANEVLSELTDVARRRLDEFIDVRAYGDEVSARMDADAKMKALELLGKAHKLFTENINHGGSIRREYVIVPPESE